MQLKAFKLMPLLEVQQPSEYQPQVYAALRWNDRHSNVTGAVLQSIGHISGCHINPAVTVAMFVTRNIPLFRAVCYIVMQCMGATAGSALLKVSWARGGFAFSWEGNGGDAFHADIRPIYCHWSRATLCILYWIHHFFTVKIAKLFFLTSW